MSCQQVEYGDYNDGELNYRLVTVKLRLVDYKETQYARKDERMKIRSVFFLVFVPSSSCIDSLYSG